MFDLRLLTEAVVLLRKSIAALQHLGLESVEVDVTPDDFTIWTINGHRKNLIRFHGMIRITPTSETDLNCSAAASFKLNIEALLRNLRIAGDRLRIHQVFVPAGFLAFEATNHEAESRSVSQMEMEEDYQGDWMLNNLANLSEYQNTCKIGLTANDFIEVVLNLQYFGNSVSVQATDTEFKFTTVNKEIVFRKQPLEEERCYILGIEPAHSISFKFTLHVLRAIINACKLTEVVWLVPAHGRPAILACDVLALGELLLFL